MAINLNEMGSQLGNSASQARSAAQTSSSLVSTGVKDSLVAVDGYGKTSLDVLSNMKNTILGKLSDAKGFLLNTSIADLGSLNDALGAAAAIKTEATDYVTQISSAIGQSISTVKGISDEVINGATNAMNSVTQTLDNTFSTIDGATWQINGAGSVFDTNNFLSSVNTLLSSEKLKFETLQDRLSMTSLKASILQRASYLGLANVVDGVYQSDSGNPTLTAALGDSIPQILTSGNLELVKSMVRNLGGTYVMQKAPDAIETILQNYTFGKEIPVNGYVAAADDLIATLASIDPSWNASGFSTSGHRLSLFRNISPKAKALLMTKEGYAYQIAVVQHYASTDVISQARAMYPYIALA